jgi:hypothetical protein
MFRETPQKDDAVIALLCEGKLSQDDMKRMRALLHHRLAASAMPGLVVHQTRLKLSRRLARRCGAATFAVFSQACPIQIPVP